MSSPTDIALEFVYRINEHDPTGLCEMMTEDHFFVDGGGERYEGREFMRNAWVDYLKMFPDYRIHVEDILAEGNTVAIFGEAEGTYAVDGRLWPENHWKIPSAWKAVIKGNQVLQWQVYAELAPVAEIMRSARSK